MTDAQPDRPDVLDSSHDDSAAVDDPRARRAEARAARQAAADQRRSDRALARSLAMAKRRSARSHDGSRVADEGQAAEPEPVVVEETVIETIVPRPPETSVDSPATFAEKLAVASAAARQATEHLPETMSDETPSDEPPIEEPADDPQQVDEAKQLREHARAVAKARRAEGREKLRAAKARSRSEAAALKTARRDEARGAKQAARAAKSSDRDARRDRIVEAPREPKKSWTERLRRGTSAPGGASKISARRRAMSILAGVVGLIGLTCSVVLAVGALLVALRADGSTFYDAVTGTCDVLVGPLRDVVSFSGTNAAMKESLVVWGAGSIVYLVVGLLAQSLLRPADED